VPIYLYLLIIPVLGLLIFVHEAGHFFSARANGIKIKEFGFGFPPRIFGIERGGVIYSINAIPLGGFVKMLGEDEQTNDPDSFGNKSAGRRAIVLVAGSFMNLFLAIIIFAGIAMAGQPTGVGVSIATVMPGTPAAQAGLQNGDIVQTVNGQKIADVNQFRDVTQTNLDKPVTITVERNGKPAGPFTLTPRANPPAGQGAMGVVIQAAKVEYIRYWPWEAAWMGVQTSFTIIFATIAGLISIVQGVIAPDFAGPIGIAQLTAEVVSSAGGFWQAVISLFNLAAFLSINLFILNLLPLPALDGGRLLFVIIEAVRGGKKISPQKEGYVHFIGFVALLLFIVVISYFDVLRAFSGQPLLK
jgi:regulator of sigma E protease